MDLTNVLKELMLQNFLTFATFSNFIFISGDVYSKCYPYETYCLFSFGPNVFVNNVKEAQKICEDAKNGSWLLEIVDNRTLKNVNEFLSNHSFPVDAKWILNAEKVGSEWWWIKSESVIRNNIRKLLNDDGDALFHQHSKETSGNKYFRFTFICTTGCHSKIIKHENKRYAGATFQTNKSKTQCLELCEQSKCEGWEWVSNEDINGCGTHSTITGNMSDSIGTLFLLDKSVKTTDICVGNVKESERLTFSNDRVLVAIFTAVIFTLAIIITIIVATALWRRGITRNRILATTQNSLRERSPSFHQYEVIRSPFSQPGPSIESGEEHIYMHIKRPTRNV